MKSRHILSIFALNLNPGYFFIHEYWWMIFCYIFYFSINISVSSASSCAQFSSQRKSIMSTLLQDYDKATFPSNETIDVQAEVRSSLKGVNFAAVSPKKFLLELLKNDFSRGNFMRKSIARILEV
jgi:hypothetical protein